MGLKEQIISAFQVEHKEQVEGIRSILASLQHQSAAPSDSRWDEAFRMAHTLKGGARVCDLHGIEAIGHRMESLFAEVREGSMKFDPEVAKALYRALDDIEDGMASLASGGLPQEVMASLTELETLLDSAKTKVPDEGNHGLNHEVCPTSGTLDADGAQQHCTSEVETLRVQTQDLDAVLRSVDSFLDVNGRYDHATGELTRLGGQVRDLQRQCETVLSTAAPALRRLNAMPEFAGIGRHVEAVALQARRISRQLRTARTAQQQTQWTVRALSEELRHAAERTRMACAENILQGLGPMVRSLARDEKKEVEFRAVGLNVQADRRVLQSLKDVLLHALRNAVVHGIEPQQERIARGKNPIGQISLTFQRSGNLLSVRVEDDGRGINMETVSRVAIERGFLPNLAQDSEAGAEELRKILFRPGFSTSSTVNELSGRGMGLSVVYETIKRLRGSVRIGPGSGSGTALEIYAPMVVSAERLLLVSADSQIFALPVRAIESLLQISEKDMRRIDDRRVLIADDSPLPLVFLADILGIVRSAAPEGGKIAVAVLHCDSQRLGVVVDSFVAEREALIKNLDSPAAGVSLFCGAILLDDSDVALVLDPSRLVTQKVTAMPSAEIRQPAKAKKTPTVLVVDDSFTTRTLEKSILETNGYNVLVAVDGVEALTKLRSEPIDIIVADVQMPRMDGLTLLQEIRGDEKLRSLPLILVTSLDRPNDFERGMTLGANAYIVKRRFDHQELLNTLQNLL